METLTAISRWLAKQHVVTWCVQQEGELWCANAFYLFDAQKVAFYILTEEKTRHAQMSGPQAAVAGTVNGQPKTVALIRGVQFKGEIRRLEGEESERARQAYNRRFPVARMLSAPVWEIRLDEIKFTDNTLGFGKKLVWLRGSGTEQAKRLAVKRWQIVRRPAGNQLIFIDHHFLIVKFRARVFNINNDWFNGGQLTTTDHIGADQQLGTVTDGENRFAAVHKIAGEGDKTVVATQIIW